MWCGVRFPKFLFLVCGLSLSSCNGAGGGHRGNDGSEKHDDSSSRIMQQLSDSTPQANPGDCRVRLMNVDPLSPPANVLNDGVNITDPLEFSYDSGYLIFANEIVRLDIVATDLAEQLQVQLPCQSGMYHTVFFHSNQRSITAVSDATEITNPGQFRARFINLSAIYPTLRMELQTPPIEGAPASHGTVQLEQGQITDYLNFSDASYAYQLKGIDGSTVFLADEIPCFSDETCTVTFLDSPLPNEIISIVISDGPATIVVDTDEDLETE